MLNHLGTRTIETPRLVLRRYTVADAPAMFENWANDAEVTRYMRWKPHANVEESRSVLQKWVSSYDSQETYLWGIVRKEGNLLIGSISAGKGVAYDRCIEAGYCIGRAFWGNGYTAEALQAVIHYLLFDVGFNRIEAYHSVHNPASGRVMQKAGMILEGCAKEKYLCSEGFQDANLYGIVKSSLYYPDPEFMFLDPGEPSDGEISLVCTEKQPAIPEKNYVPGYNFEIRRKGEKAGEIRLRIGFTDGLYYAGHIGYEVEEAFRGHSYAAKACKLLVPLIKRHGFKQVLISNDPENWASRRTCEKVGAHLVRIADVPHWHELFSKLGHSRECVWEWRIT